MRRTITLLSLSALVGCVFVGADGREAERQAAEFADKMKLDVAALSCMSHDSDGDGYVSCTIRLHDETMMYVECAGAWNMKQGCRGAQMVKPEGLRK